MENKSQSLSKYIEKMKAVKLPDFAGEIQKSRGIKRLIKLMTFKLTLWIIEPIIASINENKEAAVNYSQQLESELSKHDSEIEKLNRIVQRMQNDYNHWIIYNEPTEFELKVQRGYKFSYEPKISLVLSTLDMNFGTIVEVVQSIRAQTYNNWDLHIVSNSDILNANINEQYIKDDRIEWHNIDDSDYDREIIEIANKNTIGDFVGLLSANNTLTPTSIFEIVKLINELSDADLIYGDEDEIRNNKRCNPIFKPNFAPDTLRSTNYIGQFFVIRKNLINQISQNLEYTGDLFYEVLLHTSELTNNLHRISKILHHKYNNEESEVSEHSPHNGKNSEIIKSHISRQLECKSTVGYIGIDDIYRVDYEVAGNPKVSILIPNKDNIELLEQCITSIINLTTYSNYEILIIENNSSNEDTFAYYTRLEELSHARIIYYPEKAFNYQKIINFGVINCETDYILQLNNDMQLLTPNWLELMLGFAQRNDVGAVSGKLYYPDMSIQHAGGILTQDEHVCDHIFRYMPKDAQGYTNRESIIQNMSWVTGACLFCSKDIYEQVGYMTEDFMISYGDVDFCMKIRAKNKTIIYNPFVELIHYEGVTRGHDMTQEKLSIFIRERKLFVNKWRNELEIGDPYYTPGMDRVVFPWGSIR